MLFACSDLDDVDGLTPMMNATPVDRRTDKNGRHGIAAGDGKTQAEATVRKPSQPHLIQA